MRHGQDVPRRERKARVQNEARRAASDRFVRGQSSRRYVRYGQDVPRRGRKARLSIGKTKPRGRFVRGQSSRRYVRYGQDVPRLGRKARLQSPEARRDRRCNAVGLWHEYLFWIAVLQYEDVDVRRSRRKSRRRSRLQGVDICRKLRRQQARLLQSRWKDDSHRL